MEQIVKRDGRVVSFDEAKITTAIWKAMRAVGDPDESAAKRLAERVTQLLDERFVGELPTVEEIQDLVEDALIAAGYTRTAKAYILYRKQHADLREMHGLLTEIPLVENYLNDSDWRVRENSNMTYSLQGLNTHITDKVISRYWLTKIYPEEIRQRHEHGDFHIHDLGTLGAYTYYGKEVIITRVNERIKLLSFERLFNDLPGEPIPLNKADGAYAKYPSDDVYVLDKSGWTKVVQVTQKRKQRPMRFVKNRGGRSVIVTDNHPMITQEGEKEAQEVNGDDSLFTVDLERLFEQEKLFSVETLDFLELLRKCDWKGDALFYDGVPLEELAEDTRLGGIIHTQSFTAPRHIQLTENFGYFVGFTLAEGFISYDKDSSQRISLTQKDKGPLLQANKGLLDNGISGCLIRKNERYELRVKNPFLRFLFEQVFEINPGARHKSLPIELLHYTKPFVRGAIAGLLDGDGNIESSGTTLSVRVAARTLLEQLAVVMDLLGFVPRDRAIEGQGTEHVYRGKKIIQRYPLYGISFRKREEDLPSEKYRSAGLSTKAWHDEDHDEWHKVVNNIPVEIPDDVIYDITTESGTLIVNGMWNHNCVGWDLHDLLLRGFRGVRGKIEARPAKHFRVALLQIVNFMYTLQGESAGAQAFSNLDTYLAPFIRADRLSYKDVKQHLQEFVYNINVPTRVGFQSLTWDELVVVRHNGRIEIAEIGQLVDEQFDRNSHRVLSQGNDSNAVKNADDAQALAFDDNGHVVWAPIKAFVRHRVPKGADFVRVRTSRGTASVSQAHSLFAFKSLDGSFNPCPMAARDVEVAHGNATLSPTNHFLAVRRAPNNGTRTALNLAELIDAVPRVAERARVRVPDPAGAVEQLRHRVHERFGGLTPFYLEYGIKDKSCWKRWAQSGALPYRVWRALGEDEPGAEFALRNSALWYAPGLKGERLDEFIRLLAWYVTEGHNDITNGLYVSQMQGSDQEEIMRVMNTLQALGCVEEAQGWSAQGNPVSTVSKMAGKGLLAELIGYLGGTYSTNKVIPWFIYDLAPKLQEIFIATLIRGDGSEHPDYYDYHTTSKKLSLGFSLLLAMNEYKFSVYKTSYEQEAWNDQYVLRIYKDKDAPERYSVDHLLGRVCTRRETYAYEREYEYDLSVDTKLENFAGGSGLLCFHNTPFTNVTLDLEVPRYMRGEPVIIGGKLKDTVYGDYQREMDLFNRAFAEVMIEGDLHERPFTFPIPTYNITEEFNWDNENLRPVWEMTAKYGIPYFSNFIGSDMKPEDTRSMCCRLRIDNRELRKRGGGLFGANPLTGSIGVVTINTPRLGYLAKDEAEFFDRLGNLMELAKESLIIKRKTLESLTDMGLYPYSKFYLQGIKETEGGYWKNHFSTIGIIGMNEALLNLYGISIADPEGRDLAARVLDFMRDRLADFQEETGEIFNLEATPAEGASYRLAKRDLERYPDIRIYNLEKYGGDTPYYTNSTHLPVGLTDDLFSALQIQDPLQTRYTGGTVFHAFLGERSPSAEATKQLVRKIAENFHLPYYTLTPTFSVCPKHGYIPGEHKYCPKCDQELVESFAEHKDQQGGVKIELQRRQRG